MFYYYEKILPVPVVLVSERSSINRYKFGINVLSQENSPLLALDLPNNPFKGRSSSSSESDEAPPSDESSVESSPSSKILSEILALVVQLLSASLKR